MRFFKIISYRADDLISFTASLFLSVSEEFLCITDLLSEITMTAWKQLTIYVSESDSWQHQPLHQALLGIARKQRIIGMTVMPAISGYGKHGIFRTMNELDPSTEFCVLPLVLTVIDSEIAIAQALTCQFAEFFSLVKDMLKDKFVTCQSIEVLSPLVTLQGQ